MNEMYFNSFFNGYSDKNVRVTVDVLNQLYFRTNSNTILPFIRSKSSQRTSPEQFSLNSVQPMPGLKALELNDMIRKLSLMNVTIPAFKGELSDNWWKDYTDSLPRKLGPQELNQEIERLAGIIESDQSINDTEKSRRLDSFRFARQNLLNFGFISQIDWRLENWGTIEDILSVTEETFFLNTPYIEFTTVLTPPITAIKTLANTFPSVRFELLYRTRSEVKWNKQEIFPLNPFGY